MKKELPDAFLKKLEAITAKRPRTVIDQILEHGFVTTEDLKRLGYEHAPRAARDVRELGIPLETFKVKDSNGRNIAAYRSVKDAEFCMTCFWAYPERHTHVAGKEQRQIVITFTGDEIKDYNRLIALAGADKAEEFIKKLIKEHIQ